MACQKRSSCPATFQLADDGDRDVAGLLTSRVWVWGVWAKVQGHLEFVLISYLAVVLSYKLVKPHTHPRDITISVTSRSPSSAIWQLAEPDVSFWQAINQLFWTPPLLSVSHTWVRDTQLVQFYNFWV